MLELIAAGGNVYYLAKFAGIPASTCRFRRAADRHERGSVQGAARASARPKHVDGR